LLTDKQTNDDENIDPPWWR